MFEPNDLKGEGMLLVYLLFMLASVFLIVILLNLLIAIISDTYATVQNEQQRRMYQEFAQIIMDNDFIMPLKTQNEYDKNGNYLFIAKYQQGSEEDNQTNELNNAERQIP